MPTHPRAIHQFACRNVLFIDLETRSACDLKKHGSARYAADPTTDIILVAYAVGNGPAQVWEPLSEPAPEAFLAMWVDPSKTICAHGDFDRVVLSRLHVKLGLPAPPPVLCWRDTSAVCAYNGLPRNLKAAAEWLRLPTKKMDEGKALIERFSKPQKVRKPKLKKGEQPPPPPALFAAPEDHPEDWAMFKTYASVDVEVMRQIVIEIGFLPGQEEANYRATIAMTEGRGIPLDMPRVRAVARRVELLQEEAGRRVCEATGLGTAGSPNFIKWVAEQSNTPLANTQAMDDARAAGQLPNRVAELVDLRGAYNRAAPGKAASMLDFEVGGRVFGSLKYAGAQTTQRMSGAGIQPQNFARPTVEDDAIEAFCEAAIANAPIPTDAAAIMREIDTAASSMRSMFAHPDGVIWVDFSGVELRAAALLGAMFATQEDIDVPPEGDLLAQIRSGADLYIPAGVAIAQSLAAIATDPVVAADLRSVDASNAKARGFRQMGKTVILSAQYASGGPRMGEAIFRQTGRKLSDAEAKAVVQAYRVQYPQISQIWNYLQRTILQTLADGRPRGVEGFFEYQRSESQGQRHIHVLRASGSALTYRNARSVNQKNSFGNHVGRFVFDASKGGSSTMDEYPHGGQLLEHIVSSYSRDLLHHALLEADRAGLKPFLAVHDELVCPGGEAEMEMLLKIMTTPPPWAAAFPLGAEGNFGARWGK